MNSPEAEALIAVMDESNAVRDLIIEMAQKIMREATALEARLDQAEGLLRRVASGEETVVIRTTLLEKIHLFLGGEAVKNGEGRMVMMTERMFNEVCEENESLTAENERLQARLFACEHNKRQVQARLAALEASVDRAMDEIGVPGSGYPASISNAYYILLDGLGRERPSSIRATMDGEEP